MTSTDFGGQLKIHKISKGAQKVKKKMSIEYCFLVPV